MSAYDKGIHTRIHSLIEQALQHLERAGPTGTPDEHATFKHWNHQYAAHYLGQAAEEAEGQAKRIKRLNQSKGGEPK